MLTTDSETTPETIPNPVTNWLKGRGVHAPIAELAAAVAAAETALADAEAAYRAATLDAATGDAKAVAALKEVRARLNAAREAHDDAVAARGAAEKMASERSAQANRDEQRRLWRKTRQAAEERARVAKSIAVEIAELERLVKELDGANRKLAALSPISLGAFPHSSATLAAAPAVRAEIEIQLIARGLIAKKLAFASLHDHPDFEAKIASGNAYVEGLAATELAKLDAAEASKP